MMQKLYSDAQIIAIRDQSFATQCGCPAQVCVAIDNMRSLYIFENNCLDRDETDRAVHVLVRNVAEQSHAALEKCLTEVLELEGWDMTTLKMPSKLKERIFEKTANRAPLPSSDKQ